MSEQNRPLLTEEVAWDGRTLTVTWQAAPYHPERGEVTQVSGLCFTTDGQILLVSNDTIHWTLPGGPPRDGETLEAALERELRDEAAARLVSCRYIGCQEVTDPDRLDGNQTYSQCYYWVRVELYPFESTAATVERRVIAPAAFLATLAWGNSLTARALAAAGLTLNEHLVTTSRAQTRQKKQSPDPNER